MDGKISTTKTLDIIKSSTNNASSTSMHIKLDKNSYSNNDIQPKNKATNNDGNSKLQQNNFNNMNKNVVVAEPEIDVKKSVIVPQNNAIAVNKEQKKSINGIGDNVVSNKRSSQEIIEECSEEITDEDDEVIIDMTVEFPSVRDIDAADGKNLMLVSEYVNDIYDYLFQLEEEQMVRHDHLSEHTEIHSKMRTILLDWLNEVHYQFHLVGEVFQLAVGMIDRYLQVVNDTKRCELQLVGVTALFMASKYEEIYPPPISDFVYITDDTYTSTQIRHMEMEIFQKLDFKLSRPIPLHFLRRFSKAGNAEDMHHAMAKYFIELALVEYELASYKPSEVGFITLNLHFRNFDNNIKK